jgi:putative FmdB family regulatory protein
MPLYEYQCDACGNRFEVIQKYSDPPVDVCRSCGKGPVQRLPSSPAIQFKGSGFYLTDYAHKEKGPLDRRSAESSDGTKTEGAKTDGAKTEGAKTDGAKTDSAKTDTATKSGTPAASKSTPPPTGGKD